MRLTDKLRQPRRKSGLHSLRFVEAQAASLANGVAPEIGAERGLGPALTPGALGFASCNPTMKTTAEC